MKLVAIYDEPDIVYKMLFSSCKELPLDRQWNNQKFHTQAYRKDNFEYRFYFGEINFVEVYSI